MNKRPITGTASNINVLATLAAEFLPYIMEDSKQQAGNVDAVQMRIRHFIQQQKDMKQLLRRGRRLPVNSVKWALKTKADAGFDELRLRGDKSRHLENYRNSRKMEFLLKSIIKMAEEGNVSSNA